MQKRCLINKGKELYMPTCMLPAIGLFEKVYSETPEKPVGTFFLLNIL